MHIPLAIKYLFPSADPIRDFVVQDDGPTPVLREGAEEKGRVRYEIKPPEEGEEPIEGIHYRYVIDYGLLTEGEDYDIVNKGPYIAAWNLPEPQPTQAELEAAWAAYEASPPPVPLDPVAQLQADTAALFLAIAQLQGGGGA